MYHEIDLTPDWYELPDQEKVDAGKRFGVCLRPLTAREKLRMGDDSVANAFIALECITDWRNFFLPTGAEVKFQSGGNIDALPTEAVIGILAEVSRRSNLGAEVAGN